MDLLDKLAQEISQEINEAISSNISQKGKFRVIQPNKSDDGGDGGDGEPKPGEDGKPKPGKGKPKPGKGKPGEDGEDGEPGEPGDPGEPGEPGEGKDGDKKPGEGKPRKGRPDGVGPEGPTKAKVEWKDGQLHIDGKPVGPKVADDHSGQGKGSISDFDDIIRKTYDEVSERMERGGDGSGGKGTSMEKVGKYLKPKFNIKPILKRLDDFKRLIGKQITEAKHESYAAAQHNPASQTGDMMRPMKIPGGKKKDIVKESAILIFAVDTSGSISNEDFQFIFGFLKKIEEHFAKPMTIRDDSGEKVGSLTGEVYLLEWDHGVHLPMRKWTNVSSGKPVLNVTKEKEDAAREVRGRGGNDINKMFRSLDKLFYREIKGKPYFDIDETANYITMDRELHLNDPDNNFDDDMINKDSTYTGASGKNGAKHFRVPLKKAKRTSIKELDRDRVSADVDLTPGTANFMEGKKKMANVPFLLIYTDGGEPRPADYTNSKLYADNPGNIMYILTNKSNLDMIRPVNVTFHDVHQKEED